MVTHHDATETYSLIITRRDATEILLLPNGAEWTLPRVEIRKHQRVAEQLTAETQKGWGLETCCLFVVPYALHDSTYGFTTSARGERTWNEEAAGFKAPSLPSLGG